MVLDDTFALNGTFYWWRRLYRLTIWCRP